MTECPCATCHGPEGQGKIGPALKGTSLTADQITDLLTKGNDAKKLRTRKPWRDYRLTMLRPSRISSKD